MFSRSTRLSAVDLAVALAVILAGILADALGQNCPPGGCPAPQWQPARPIVAPVQPAAQALDPAVVQVAWRSGNRLLRGTGTIVGILNSTPRVAAVLTAGHGVQPGGTLTVTYAGAVYPARVVDRDDSADLALLLFDAPTPCHYYKIATDVPPKGSQMTWSGFANGSKATRRVGPVYSHDESMIWVSGNVLLGMSGGPIFSRRYGLVSIITEGVDFQCRTPAVPTHCRGPILSRLRNFLGCGRYAWVLQGCVTPAAERPPVPDQPTPAPPSVDLTGVLAELAALRLAVENIQLQPGEKGDKGDPGDDGVSPTIDYDQLAAEVVKRLPPRKFQAKTPDGKPSGPIVEKRWDEIVYLKSALAE
ncbi:MAG: S1 family peptidase [Planctomycetota bacterium]|jgi:hypothetical protein